MMYPSFIGKLLCLLPLFGLVSGFPGTEESHGNSAHKALHKRCPYAAKDTDAGSQAEKRFLFDGMNSPVDSMLCELLRPTGIELTE